MTADTAPALASVLPSDLEQVCSVASAGAAAADREAAFPAAAIDALRRCGLLGAAVPAALGGGGLGPGLLTRIACKLSRACGATGMTWAMHQVQVACVSRHGATSPTLVDLLSRVVTEQLLVASVTSEQGVGGKLRVSKAAVDVAEGGRVLEKMATVVSYGAQAGAYLITARPGPQSAESDQVAALVLREQVELEPLTTWNPMGMRGTCSPGFRVRARFEPSQILPAPFGEIAEATMVPLSHLLWSAVWIGLASEAFERSRKVLRQRSGAATGGPVAERRLAEADLLLTGLEARLADAVARYEPVYAGNAAPTHTLLTHVNALKLAASTETVQIAQLALEICGMAGYQEDGPHSISRLLRDLYSARLMIANDRLLDTNAVNLLLTKRD